MELNDFKKFLEEEDFTDNEGGCAIAIASDSEGNTTAFVKGNSTDIMKRILCAMSKSTGIRQSILDAAYCYELINKN